MHAYTFDEDRAKGLGSIAVVSVLVAIGLSAVWARLDAVPPWLFGAPTVAAVFGGLYRALDRRAWHWKLAQAAGLTSTPDLRGTYRGFLISSYDTEHRIPITLVVDQTWTRINVHLDAGSPTTSTSDSTAASLVVRGSDRNELTYTYHSTVRPGIADADMTSQDGTAALQFTVDGVVSGTYFSSRLRGGTMELRRQAA